MKLVNSVRMKKVMFLLLILMATITRPCSAIDTPDNDLMSLLSVTLKTVTPERVTSLLGQPIKVEENKKRTWWYYKHDNTKLVISWNKKSEGMEKFSFTNESTVKNVFDNIAARKLRSGTTDLMQTVKILGMPKDMTIKSVTQEMHYAYQQCVLRLFFRNRTLVDYTLITNSR